MKPSDPPTPNVITNDGSSPEPGAGQLIAPRWHTAIMLLLLCVPIVAGIIRQMHGQPPHAASAAPAHPANLVRLYGQVLVYEWLLVLFVWFGVRRYGLQKLIGGNWSSPSRFFSDLGIGALVWLAMLGIARFLDGLLPALQGNSINVVPQSAVEMALWISLSATAGFVEELVFRGYLQQQFARFGLPVAGAIALQAVVFAFGHIYEGANSVVVISVYAVMFGILAAALKNLRPGMIGHVTSDVMTIVLARSS